jgi:hypothetical protein
MIRRVLAFLRRFLAVILLSLLIIVCVVGAIDSNRLPIIVALWLIAAASVYGIRLAAGLVDRPLPEHEKAGSVFAGGFWIFVGAGFAALYFFQMRAPERKYPALSDLQVSTGILNSGIGNAHYLKREGLPDLKLICAYTSGKGSSEWCNYENEAVFVGKRVIVYHSNPYKSVLWRARYYEMRSGNRVITSYEHTVASLRSRELRSRMGYDWSIIVMLLIMGLYMPIEYAIRRRRQNMRLKPLDESTPATQ